MPSGTQTSFFSRYNRRDHSKSASSAISKTSSKGSSSDDETPVTPKPQLMPSQIFSNMSMEVAKEIHEEFLICKICLDAFNKPKSLGCLHTFCQSCIEQHISAEVTYNKVTDYHHFTCPLCRKRTTLPVGGVRKLPDNFFVSGLADLLARTPATGTAENTPAEAEDSVSEIIQRRQLGKVGIKESGECEICGQFGDANSRGRSSTPAKGRQQSIDPGISAHRATSATFTKAPTANSKCLDCNKLLCESCVRRHRAIKVTQNHAIFDLATESSIVCPNHPGEPVRFYCEPCSTCVCVLCTFDEHREHEMTNFPEAGLQLREELKKHIEETEGAIKKSKKLLEVLGETGQFIKKLETTIKETVDRHIDELHKQEDNLIEQLRTKVGKTTLQTLRRVPEWETQVAYLESVQSELRNLLDGQDINVLLTSTDIKEKLRKLGQLEITGALPLAICPTMAFVSDKVSLGHLDFSTPGGDKKGSNAPLPPPPPVSQLEHSTQTNVVRSVQEPKTTPQVKDAGTGTDAVPPPPQPKQVRHRASNTIKRMLEDQETNTRPRGVDVSLTFGGDAMIQDVMENYLAAFVDVENSGQNEAFAAMDNLTRARVRRKLKERRNTVDNHENEDTLKSEPVSNTRRFSGITRQ